VLAKAPWVDVVFGTHNIAHVPALLEKARLDQAPAIEILDSLVTFPSNLPTRRESAYSAWVTISVGCNNTCSFCLVPLVRGKETDRRPADIVNEVRMLVEQGVQEVTLLGQNVNTYGVEFAGSDAFADLLREVGSVEGLRRLRFASPHPAYFTDTVIAAMAETKTVMPSLHMPLQSGSNEILKKMKRAYRRERFIEILSAVRQGIPGAAITTDVIVGFPSETDQDFEETLDVIRQGQFSAAFTFLYSPRPGTLSASMPDQIPHEVAQERYERLIQLVDFVSWEQNKALVGREVEVLFATGEGRKDEQTQRISGRAQDNRLVHVAIPADSPLPRPGDIATTTITYAAPHHLLADAPITNLIRTAGGDAWQAQNESTQTRVPIRRE
jgi:tRNA-2-methylthio-N6-dimethylallyladenosine synthase